MTVTSPSCSKVKHQKSGEKPSNGCDRNLMRLASLTGAGGGGRHCVSAECLYMSASSPAEGASGTKPLSESLPEQIHTHTPREGRGGAKTLVCLVSPRRERTEAAVLGTWQPPCRIKQAASGGPATANLTRITDGGTDCHRHLNPPHSVWCIVGFFFVFCLAFISACV